MEAATWRGLLYPQQQPAMWKNSRSFVGALQIFA